MAQNRARMIDLSTCRHAPATVVAYKCDWADFEAWCEKHQRQSLPATPETVGLYISHLVPIWSNATLRRRVAAIASKHHSVELPAPITPMVRNILAGAKRRNPKPPGKKKAFTVDELLTMSRYLRTVEGWRAVRAVRDRAMILLGFAAAFRRSEMSALHLSDIDLRDDRVVLRIGKSKTDQMGKGRDLIIPRANREELCAVRAIAAWLTERGSWAGPLFCHVRNMSGAIARKPVSGVSIYYSVRSVAERAGLDPKRFGAHSLRSGAITAAAEDGASVFDIMSLSGHKTYENVKLYVQPATPNYPLRKVL